MTGDGSCSLPTIISRPSIENEAKNGVSNTRGTLAMARTSGLLRDVPMTMRWQHRRLAASAMQRVVSPTSTCTR